VKNEKGVSKLGLFLIIAIIIIAAIYWAGYFAKPMATVMMGGADQALPAIEKARQVSDVVNKANKVVEDQMEKINEDAEKEK
jgi:hypothetical protein